MTWLKWDRSQTPPPPYKSSFSASNPDRGWGRGVCFSPPWLETGAAGIRLTTSWRLTCWEEGSLCNDITDDAMTSLLVMPEVMLLYQDTSSHPPPYPLLFSSSPLSGSRKSQPGAGESGNPRWNLLSSGSLRLLSKLEMDCGATFSLTGWPPPPILFSPPAKGFLWEAMLPVLPASKGRWVVVTSSSTFPEDFLSAWGSWYLCYLHLGAMQNSFVFT